MDRTPSSFDFTAEVVHWRGPAPFVFAPVPDHLVEEVRAAAKTASYGWGVVPVSARIGETNFTTSLFPRNGGYLLPIKVAVRRAETIDVGDTIRVEMEVAAKQAY